MGNDKNNYKFDVKSYEEVILKNVYHGIDMRFYFENGFAKIYIVDKGYNFIKLDGTLLWNGETWFNGCSSFNQDGAIVLIEKNEFNLISTDGQLKYKNNMKIEYFSDFNLTPKKSLSFREG